MEKLWITTKELAQIKNISDRAIRKAIAQDKYVVRKNSRTYQVLVSSLDEQTQELLNQNNPNPDKIPSEKEKQLALAKFSLVEKFRKYRSENTNKTEASKDFLNLYNQKFIHQDIYEILKSTSLGTLYRWDKTLKANNNDYSSLINNYVSKNKDTSILKSEEQEIFLSLLLHNNQINIGKAIKWTKNILKEQDFNEFASDKTYRRFANNYKKKHYDKWIFAREGGKALKDKVLPYISRDISKLEVGEVLIADGHRLAFQVLNPFDGKPTRPMLIAYQDWKSGALVGFEIMLEENTQCIASALRNSIINLGKIPKFIYQDNGKAFKAKYFIEKGMLSGIFAKLGIQPVFAKPYNAKAKSIERFFKEMQDGFERFLPSFMGSSIDNRPAYLKRNEKIHQKYHNDFMPTIEQTIELLHKWLDFHYSQPCPNMKGKAIGEVFFQGRGTGVDIEKLDDLMMATQIKKIGRNGIRFLKSDYFDEILYGLREEVLIKYSLFDLSYIKVYKKDGAFLCVAKRLESLNPLANYIGEAKDVEDLKYRLKQQKKLENQTVKDYLKSFKKEEIFLPVIQEIELDVPECKKIVHFEEEVKQKNNQVFENKFEKYEWLLSQKNLQEKDIKWIENYKNTSEYKLIFENKQERKKAI
ncbi:MAG: Mu transposase C-terminal domain-containing protein [Candidatus Gastranaerophilales bacterium]